MKNHLPDFFCRTNSVKSCAIQFRGRLPPKLLGKENEKWKKAPTHFNFDLSRIELLSDQQIHNKSLHHRKFSHLGQRFSMKKHQISDDTYKRLFWKRKFDLAKFH